MSARDAYLAYAAAKNAGDVDGAMEGCAPGVCYTNAASDEPTHVGRDAVATYFRDLDGLLPGYRVDREGLVTEGDTVVAWGRLQGEVASSGSCLDLPVLFVCRFQDGLLMDEQGWFDSRLMLEQVALAPTASTYRERWEAAWADPTPDRLVDLWDPEVRIRYPGTDEPLDLEGARKWWKDTFELLPDLHPRLERWTQHGNDVTIEMTASATIGAGRVEWDVVDVVTLRHDRPVRIWTYSDLAKVTSALASI